MAERTAARACRVCGCTWASACEGGCYWVESDLCSACAELEGQAAQVAHVAPYKNKAHRSIFAAGWKAARKGASRSAPYEASSRTSAYFRRAWLAGYDSAGSGEVVP